MQDEAAEKVHSEFLRGDFEDLLKPGSSSASIKTRPDQQEQKSRGLAQQGGVSSMSPTDEPKAVPISTAPFHGGPRLFRPFARDQVPSNSLLSTATAPGSATAPDPPSKPIAVQPRRWQHLRGRGTAKEGMDSPSLSAEETPSQFTDVEGEAEVADALTDSNLSEPNLAAAVRLSRRRRLAKRRRRLLSRSQDESNQDSAFTRYEAFVIFAHQRHGYVEDCLLLSLRLYK